MKTANDNRGVPVTKAAGRPQCTVVEGEEAVDLYAGEIARNMAELNEQADLLRELYVETKNLLRDIE